MSQDSRLRTVVAGLAVLPAAHPLLLPWVGVASHLLWWVHVLPLALVTYRYGRRALVPSMGVSGALLASGERLFGAGYGIPADWATVLSLLVALLLTEALVGGFALYARNASNRYRLLFMKAESGVVRTSVDGRILEANPAAERIIGRSRNELRGRAMEDIPELAPLPDATAIQSSGGWTGSVEVQGEDGLQVRYLMAAVARQDEPPGHQILLMDRTAEVSVELEKERQRKLATLGEALAGVAHELKNPLTVILAHGAMVRDGSHDGEEDLLRVVEEMRFQGERMRALVDELLGYSRPTAARAETDLGRLLHRLLRMEAMIRGRRIRLEERIRWKGSVCHPEARIEQIVTNLLSNAAEAMGKEGRRAELRCWREEDRVTVEVADSGPGIPPEFLDRIFQPFVTTKADSGGTGLGLAISRRLARAMGGDLTARNRASGGAAFRLSLPATEGPCEAGGVDEAVGSDTPRPTPHLGISTSRGLPVSPSPRPAPPPPAAASSATLPG
jgi:signal transduction histidine kinase